MSKSHRGEKNSRWKLKMNITDKHRQVANLLWQGELTVEKIAEQFQIAPATIYNWKNKPEFQAILTEIDETYRLNARRKAIRLSNKAIDTLEKLLDENREKAVDTARKSAVDLLTTAEVKTEEGETKGSIDLHIFRETISDGEKS